MRKWNWQLGIVFILLSLVLAFADGQGYLNPIKGALLIVLTPGEKVVYEIRGGIAGAYGLVRFWRNGEERIKNLEQRNLELITKTNKLKQVEQENSELRKQLGVTALSTRQQLAAGVLGVAKYMTLDVGEKEGVRVGQAVVYLDNLVGRVVKTLSHISYVQLPIDSEMKISVKVGTTGEVRGIAIGQFGSSILLDQIAQTDNLNVSDLVTTTGEEQSIASEMLVGKISKIVSKETDVFKRAEIEPLIQYERLKTVFVLLD